MRFSLILKKLKKCIRTGKPFVYYLSFTKNKDTYVRFLKYANDHFLNCSFKLIDTDNCYSALSVIDYDPLADDDWY